MSKCKYPVWANLNDKGLEAWGDVFPDGMIPIRVPVYQISELEGMEGVIEIHAVNLGLLDKDTKTKLYRKLADKFKVPIKIIQTNLEQSGLPLRRVHCRSVGIDPRFVI